MNRDVTIVAPVYLGQPHRLAYFDTYIKSCLNQKDFEKLNFVFLVEPDFLDFDPIARLRKYPNIRVLVNPFKYGLLLNQYMLLYYVFEILKLDHIIYTEDDCVLSNDVYAIANYFINSKYYHESILTLMNKDNLVDPPTTFNPDDACILEIKNHYHPVETGIVYFATWGYMCTQRIWRDCLKKWEHQWCFSETFVPFMLETFPKIVTPRLSRLNHIGVEGASYNQELYDKHNFRLYTPQNFDSPLDYKYVEI
jgi:hypothetical protein